LNKRIWTIIGVVVVAGIIVGVVMVSRNTGQVGSTLQATSWEWTAMTETAPSSQSVVPNPASYTITFNNDGTMTGQADCNQFSGTYAAANGQAGFQFGPTTMAECGPESLYGTFLSKLASIDGYRLQGNELTLMFGGGAGEMMFKAR